MKAYYKKIRERLVNADHHHMPYAYDFHPSMKVSFYLLLT